MILANSYSKKRKYSDEVRVLKILAGKNESSYQAQMLLGQRLLKEAMASKDPESTKRIEIEAIRAFRVCLKIRPNFKPAFDELLNTLLTHKGAASDARELIAEGVSKFGERPELVMELCRLDAQNGYVTQAVASCRQAKQISPGFPDSYVYLSQALYDQEENTQAEQELVTAAKRFPASEFVQWSAGTVFFRKKNYPVSSRYFGQAVKADPVSSRSQFGYAQSLFESGQEGAALPEFAKACKMDPAIVTDAFFTAGSRLRQKGNKLGEKYKEMAFNCHK
jgi:tetratricopeptide (TPR) repeat protein